MELESLIEAIVERVMHKVLQGYVVEHRGLLSAAEIANKIGITLAAWKSVVRRAREAHERHPDRACPLGPSCACKGKGLAGLAVPRPTDEGWPLADVLDHLRADKTAKRIPARTHKKGRT